MVDSIILNSPLLLTGFIIAAVLCVFDIIKPSSGYVLPLISAVICVITTIGSLLAGAELTETCVAVLIFLALNLTSYARRGGDGK